MRLTVTLFTLLLIILSVTCEETVINKPSGYIQQSPLPLDMSCANKDCNEILSHAIASLDYHAPNKFLLSFPQKSLIRVYGKHAKLNNDYWYVEIDGKFGYIPRRLVKETKIVKPPSVHTFTRFAEAVNNQIRLKESILSELKPDAKIQNTPTASPIKSAPISEIKSDDKIVTSKPNSIVLEGTTIYPDLVESTTVNNIDNAPSIETKPLDSITNDDNEEDIDDEEDEEYEDETEEATQQNSPEVINPDESATTNVNKAKDIPSPVTTSDIPSNDFVKLEMVPNKKTVENSNIVPSEVKPEITINNLEKSVTVNTNENESNDEQQPSPEVEITDDKTDNITVANETKENVTNPSTNSENISEKTVSNENVVDAKVPQGKKMHLNKFSSPEFTINNLDMSNIEENKRIVSEPALTAQIEQQPSPKVNENETEEKVDKTDSKTDTVVNEAKENVVNPGANSENMIENTVSNEIDKPNFEHSNSEHLEVEPESATIFKEHVVDMKLNQENKMDLNKSNSPDITIENLEKPISSNTEENKSNVASEPISNTQTEQQPSPKVIKNSDQTEEKVEINDSKTDTVVNEAKENAVNPGSNSENMIEKIVDNEIGEPNFEHSNNEHLEVEPEMATISNKQVVDVKLLQENKMNLNKSNSPDITIENLEKSISSNNGENKIKVVSKPILNTIPEAQLNPEVKENSDINENTEEKTFSNDLVNHDVSNLTELNTNNNQENENNSIYNESNHDIINEYKVENIQQVENMVPNYGKLFQENQNFNQPPVNLLGNLFNRNIDTSKQEELLKSETIDNSNNILEIPAANPLENINESTMQQQDIINTDIPSNLEDKEEEEGSFFTNILDSAKYFYNSAMETFESVLLNTLKSENTAEERSTFSSMFADKAKISTEDKVLWDMSELSTDFVFWIIVSAVTVLTFTLGYYYLDNKKQDKKLLGMINSLQKKLMCSTKETVILKEELTLTKDKLMGIEDSSFGTDEMVNCLKKELAESQQTIVELQDKLVAAEEELVNSAEAALELKNIFDEQMSSGESGSDSLSYTVSNLQSQLDDQQTTMNLIKNQLAAKIEENGILTLSLNEMSQQKTILDNEIRQLHDKLQQVSEESNSKNAQIVELTQTIEKTLQQAEDQRQSELKEFNLKIKKLTNDFNEANVLTKAQNKKIFSLQESLKLLKIDENNLEKVIGASDTKASLEKAVAEKDILTDTLENEKLCIDELNKKIETQNKDLTDMRDRLHDSEQKALQAASRLEVLTNYFNQKEADLLKELNAKESQWHMRQGEAMTTVEKIKHLQDEVQQYKETTESIKRELAEQEADWKAKVATLERRSHEQWLARRAAERLAEASSKEAQALRQRLAVPSPDKRAAGVVSPVNSNDANPDLNMLPPLSGIGGILPPPMGFLPPPLGGPLMLPPPLPPLHRPAPLGRLSSPPPPMRQNRYSPDSRYSPNRGFSPDARRSTPQHRARSPYSPQNSHRRDSYNSRYEDDRYYDSEDDHHPRHYDETETDMSPPPSPRLRRSLPRNHKGVSSGSGQSSESLERVTKRVGKY